MRIFLERITPFTLSQLKAENPKISVLGLEKEFDPMTHFSDLSFDGNNFLILKAVERGVTIGFCSFFLSLKQLRGTDHFLNIKYVSFFDKNPISCFDNYLFVPTREEVDWHTDFCLFVNWIWVDYDCQNMGIGSVMCRIIEELARMTKQAVYFYTLFGWHLNYEPTNLFHFYLEKNGYLPVGYELTENLTPNSVDTSAEIPASTEAFTLMFKALDKLSEASPSELYGFRLDSDEVTALVAAVDREKQRFYEERKELYGIQNSSS